MKKLLIAIIVLPSILYANGESTITPFPGAKKGLNIWPIKQVNMSIGVKAAKQLQGFAKNGYHETTATDEAVNSLFNMPKIAAQETRIYTDNPNPLDTHLRANISKLRLSFKFSGIPEISKQNILGFVPAGGYTNKNGWDGVSEFAQFPNLGVCSFTTFKIESAIIYKEALEYLVNNKPSDKSILGNGQTGFLYNVNWYTDTRRNSFECANKNFKPENLKEMIRIANQIDKNL